MCIKVLCCRRTWTYRPRVLCLMQWKHLRFIYRAPATFPTKYQLQLIYSSRDHRNGTTLDWFSNVTKSAWKVSHPNQRECIELLLCRLMQLHFAQAFLPTYTSKRSGKNCSLQCDDRVQWHMVAFRYWREMRRAKRRILLCVHSLVNFHVVLNAVAILYNNNSTVLRTCWWWRRTSSVHHRQPRVHHHHRSTFAVVINFPRAKWNYHTAFFTTNSSARQTLPWFWNKYTMLHFVLSLLLLFEQEYIHREINL